MNAFATRLLLCCAMSSFVYATTPRRAVRTAPTRYHSATHSGSVRRPYYGGGKHTGSHGGAFPGSINANHKNGHYQSPITGTRTYGKHK